MKRNVRLLLLAALGLVAGIVGVVIIETAESVPVIGWVGTLLAILGPVALVVCLVIVTVRGFRSAWKWSKS